MTHLAAPGFFFLLGAGMVLFAESRGRLGWSYGAIARKLIVRGLLLIALQLLVENPAWQLGGPFHVSLLSYIGVLYALGGAMIVGALLVRLRAAALVGIGLAATRPRTCCFRHQARRSPRSAAGTLLLIPGLTAPIVVNYPLIPWLGVACLGMAFGRWLLARARRSTVGRF